MRFDRNTCTRVILDMKVDVDPTNGTLKYLVGGLPHDCEWTGPAVPPTQTGGKWSRPARTVRCFAGPIAESVEPDPVRLTLGRHLTKTTLTIGTDVITEDSDPIDVK